MKWLAAGILLLIAGSPVAAHENPTPAEALRTTEAAVGRELPALGFRGVSGDMVRLDDFRGRPLLLSLVYTACNDICPTLIENLRPAVEAGQEALGRDSFAVVTIGFDSRNDTPERMRAFARGHGIDLPNWHFLAADHNTLDRLSQAVGFAFYPAAGGFEHMAQVTVIDAQGRIFQHVYGAAFEPPAIVEPLKDLVYGRQRSILSLDGILDRVKLFCTIYNPNTGRYYFNYSLFLSVAIGLACLSLIVVMLVREARKTMAHRDSRPWMEVIRSLVRTAFDAAESVLGRAFAAEWNPLLNLGALGFFFYWVVSASGVYLYIFFDTGITQAFASIEAMTVDQWYAAGVMRSLHRYASDGLIVVAVLHVLREFGRDRYRGVRWASWVTGVVVLVLVYIAGITGYWLVWDKLAQYVAIVSTEWFDKLGIFGQPIARNFLSPGMLDSRFFSLMIFMHIAVPLIALGILWLHLQRITRPRINPPRGLAAGTLLSLLALSLVHPAVSQEPADLAEVPGRIGLDWFYLPAYPLIESLPGAVTWSAGLVFLFILSAIPWLPPMRKPAVARVDLANCNGCRRCFNDCPYNAIAMIARSDGRPFEGEAAVNPSLCVSCGICAGSCPTATPFRRMSELVPGIDLPDLTITDIRKTTRAEARRLSGRGRIIVFGCANGVNLDAARSPSVGIVKLNCIGQLPPSFIDFVLSRTNADGVVLTGCAANSCQHRFGIRWTEARLARERDPQLRARIPRDRIRTLWAGRGHGGELGRLLRDFGQALAQRAPPSPSAAFPAGEKSDG